MFMFNINKAPSSGRKQIEVSRLAISAEANNTSPLLCLKFDIEDYDNVDHTRQGMSPKNAALLATKLTAAD